MRLESYTIVDINIIQRALYEGCTIKFASRVCVRMCVRACVRMCARARERVRV